MQRVFRLRVPLALRKAVFASSPVRVTIPNAPPDLRRRPALRSPRLEHPFGELQERAVRAADHGAAFGAPFVLKATDDPDLGCRLSKGA